MIPWFLDLVLVRMVPEGWLVTAAEVALEVVLRLVLILVICFS